MVAGEYTRLLTVEAKSRQLPPSPDCRELDDHGQALSIRGGGPDLHARSTPPEWKPAHNRLGGMIPVVLHAPVGRWITG